jgi:class 3 adenylate cyclase
LGLGQKKNNRQAPLEASMSVALGLGLGFFVLTAVGSVLGIGLVSGYQNTSELLRQKAELLVTAEVAQASQLFNAARNQVDFISERIKAGEVEPGPNEDFTAMMMGSLAATPQIIRIQYANSDFRLFGAERLEEETLPIFRTVGDDKDMRELLNTVRVAQTPLWGKLLWRQEYRQATLNYHVPITAEGKVIGIISAFVSTTRLSELIADLESDFGANAFVLYGRDQILAHPLMAFGYPGLNRMTPLPPQNSFSDPVIVAMWQNRPRRLLELRMLEGPGINFVSFGKEDFIVLHRKLEGYTDRSLIIGTHFSSADMLSEVFRLKWAILICIVISLFSAVTAAYIGKRISTPVRRLAEGSKKVHDLELASIEPIPGSFFRELNDAANAFNTMLDGLRWFERYVPKSLVRRLIRRYESGGVLSNYRDTAIMFTDIIGFATLTENLAAPEAARFLNEHFTLVADCVEKEGGTVDKYMGDGVLAVWGAPEDYKDGANRAFRAAIAIREAITERNRKEAAKGGPEVRMRIGLHAGRVIAGNIGSPGRINYTIVGDPVNVAQRLEQMGRHFGDANTVVNILMSGAIMKELTEEVDTVHLGQRKLRGRSGRVEVYLVRDDSERTQAETTGVT